MSSCLITGATGFIGSHLAKTLTDKGEKVVILVRDVHPSKWLDEALSGCIKVRGDIRNYNLLKRILNQYQIENVYHLAARAIVGQSLRNPMETYDTNVVGTVKLLEACRICNVQTVLVTSTDKCYGEGLNKTVSSPLAPVEPYGVSKMCQDVIAQNFAKVYNMNIIVTRACNAYGFDNNIRIIPNSIKCCLRGEKPIIWKWEETKRQYIYVQDLADALVHLMHLGKTGIFNIATPDVLTPEQVVKTILKFFPYLEPNYVEREKQTEILAQSMKMQAFGWGPKWTFEKGIQETIARFRKYG